LRVFLPTPRVRTRRSPPYREFTCGFWSHRSTSFCLVRTVGLLNTPCPRAPQTFWVASHSVFDSFGHPSPFGPWHEAAFLNPFFFFRLVSVGGRPGSPLTSPFLVHFWRCGRLFRWPHLPDEAGLDCPPCFFIPLSTGCFNVFRLLEAAFGP